MRHVFRLFWTGWLFNVKNLTLSGFFMLNAAILPVFYATIAYYMFSAGARPGVAPLRLARRRDDGHLVVDALRLGRPDPVAALAGDARVRDRRADAAHPRRSCR